MENLNVVKKVKTIVSCIVIAFVVAIVVAMVSFVQIGNARRANAEYEKQLEQLKSEESSLKEGVDYLQSEEGKDESARDQGLLPENEYEINAN